MLWTIALIVTGLGGMWLVAKHYQGWVLYLVNEVLWFVHGIKTHDVALIVLSPIWFIVGVRNLVVTYRRKKRDDERTSVRNDP